MKAGKTKAQVIDQLNRALPIGKEIALGDVINDLVTQHNALLAKIDTANVTGLGTNNVASFTVKPIDQR